MALIRDGEPSHTGSERYEITLRFDEHDQRVVEQMTPVGSVVPERIILAWTRQTGGTWRRAVNGSGGSYVVGVIKFDYSGRGIPVKQRVREIFDRDIGGLRPWTLYLPGLRPAIEEAEANLPR